VHGAAEGLVTTAQKSQGRISAERVCDQSLARLIAPFKARLET